MAKLKPSGAFSGKLGTVVGFRRNEQDLLRKVPRRTAPPTERELENRYIFKLVQDWVTPIQSFVKQGFRNYAEKLSGTNAAKSCLHRYALHRDGYASVIDPSLVKVSFGRLGLPDSISVTLEGRLLRFSWDPGIDANRDPRDRVMLLAYAPEIPCREYDLWGARRSEGQELLNMSAARPGTYHLYLAFAGKDGEGQSDSRYLGSVSIG